MAFSGTIAIWTAKDNDFVWTNYPGTTAGLQAAIDYLGGAKGKVILGPGTLQIDNVISIHSGCHLAGSGREATTIKRASGSFTGTSPAYSANMIISTALGSNGTLNDSSAKQSEIAITNLTIDGNQAAFSGVTFTAPGLVTGHYGIKLQYVDGVYLHDLTVKELLQTGIDLVSCANSRVSDIRCVNCGKYAAPASRNSFNYNNGDAAAIAAGYGVGLALANFQSKDPHDTAITLANVNDVVITNVEFDGGLIGLEVENTTSISTLCKNYAVSGIAAKNITGNLLRLSPSGSGTGFENMVFQNITCDFHATNHGNDIATIHSAALFLGRTNDAYLKGIKISNGIFRNINSFRATTEMAMVLIGLPGATPCSDIRFSNLSFYGANGATANSANKGMDIYANLQNAIFADLYFSGVEDIGVHVRPQASNTVQSDIWFKNVFIDGAQSDGFKCMVDIGGASITRVEFLNCTARNPAISSTPLHCFFVGASTATGTCQNIALRDNRGYRTSSVCNGIEVYQNGASTVDGISLLDNDMTGIGGGGAAYAKTGTPTNVWFDDLPMKGNAVASAATVTVGRGNFFGVSGTTAIDTINPYSIFDARPVTFVMGSTANMNDGTGNLVLNGNFVPTNNDTITLRYDLSNTAWYELSRSAN